MIFTITMLTFILLSVAKLLGFLYLSWPLVFSVIILIPLIYAALVILAFSSMELVEDPRKDYHDDNQV